jgi:hypothetical protein
MPVTLLDPQGQARDIPDDQVQAAIAAGGKKAVKITDPKGTPRWIPEDQKDAAIQAGGKLASDGSQKGLVSSFADSSGLSALAHPIDTILGLPAGIKQMAVDSYSNAKQGVADYQKEGLTEKTRRDFGRAVPIVGPALAQAQAQHDAGNNAGMAGTLAGTVAGLAGPEALKAIKPAAVLEKVAPVARTAIEGTADAATAVKNRIYPTPQNLPAPEAAARNLGKALVVPVQAMPNFVDAATPEAGTIKAYAAANKIPINSTVDLGKAASATAQAVQDHINKNIIAPYAEDVVTAPPDYRGTKLNVEGSRATIGQINDRINSIREQLSPNYRQATQLKTNAANVSDADLIAEKRKLVGLVSDKLAERTGLSAEDIEAVQVQAGKLRSIADEVNLSANTNTTAAGKAAMGRSDIPTGTKLGIAERLLQAVKGGPEIIGNRAVNKAFKDVSPTELVLPNPRTNPVGTAASYPIPDQSAAPQMVKPVYNEPLQEYIKRKKAAQAEKNYRSAVGLQK